MAPIGPQVPAHLLPQSTTPPPPPPSIVQEEDDDDDEDDYAPALPPDLASSRSNPLARPVAGPSRPVIGPSLGPQRTDYDDDSDDDVGPAPLPSGYKHQEQDAVREFIEREEKRRKAVEEAAKPKALQRDEWMLAPPTSSDLLSKLDPTKLTKARQFSRSAAPSGKIDNTLWTETPAERQQRLADEVMGKRRRKENAEDDDGESPEEARKRRKRDAALQRQVEEHTRSHRGPSLLKAHADREAKEKKDKDEPAGIWDHSRDMSMGGKLMDDKDRRKLIQESRGLSDRFGAGKSGGYL
ncbi:hypothetical protein OF83DRAFT_1163657 [Amylostereum chailletii]|nr:hypothetical protein OF83DRAFT_1163657 [Amylostereum chailletii]